jgi:CSLREA domain-containing protein
MSARSFRSDRTRAIRREERHGVQRAKRVAMVAGGLLAAAAVIAPVANADTYVVDSNADNGDGNCQGFPLAGDAFCTLRDAVRAANVHNNSPAGTADVITFAPNFVGPIQLNDSDGSIEITDESLDIQGPGADKLTIVGPAHDRIFTVVSFGSVQEDYDVTISGLTLTGGHAEGQLSECAEDPGDGGAILSTNSVSCRGGEAAALTLSKLNIVGNEAEGGGGGVAVEQRQDTSKAAIATGEASLTVHQSTISGNEAALDGGGIAMYSGSDALAVDNSTIVDNNANGGNGGGIDVGSRSFTCKVVVCKAPARPLEVDNSTIAGNDASDSGGGIATDSNFTVSSDIIATNTVTPPAVPEKAGTPSDVFTTPNGPTITAGYTLFGTTSGATLTPNPAGSNKQGQDPQLGPLQNNGGTTPTELPATTSPAIDTGIANGFSAEQRETARTVDRAPANAADATDMGAVELPADPIVPTPEPTPTPTPEPEPTPIPGPTTQLCLGKQVILTKGTDVGETLTGTGVDDGILGAGGVDTIDGLSGNDCLFGQVGDDLVVGGPGDDNANGDRDDDTVKGDDGADSVRGQNGNDKVFGGPGDDPKVTGGAGDDQVSGGSGDDLVKGDGGNDVIDLGAGKDSVHSGGGADVIDAADGEKDKIICGTGKDVAHVDPIDVVDDDCNTVDVVG